jgi:hypothetical protein
MVDLIGETHYFDPGGRGHWALSRCKVCQNFEDHPVHISEESFPCCEHCVHDGQYFRYVWPCSSNGCVRQKMNTKNIKTIEAVQPESD